LACILAAGAAPIAGRQPASLGQSAILNPQPASSHPQSLDPRIVALLDGVSAERLAADVRTLALFGTRHTYSDTTSPTRGIGAAREWIRGEMVKASPRLQVSFDTHQVAEQGGRLPRDVELRNVVAVLPGASPRRIYLSAHYDTVARRTDAPDGQPAFDWTRADNDAPGANDDGSGTALVIELARVFGRSGLSFDATLVFVAFAGEEQGLVGATLHAERAAAEGWRIDAVLNNDIIGNSRGGAGASEGDRVRVFSEGPEDSASRQLARYVRQVASRYQPGHEVTPVARADRFGRGGDHTPFDQRGVAAVRMTEANEAYERQHTIADTADGVDPVYLQRNARVNAAALASLALAPPAPAVTSERGQPRLGRGASGYDAVAHWTASPGAVGYRVVWRWAWAPEWEHDLSVGAVTEARLPLLSIDDVVIGVAAIGPGGHESLVSAYVVPARPAAAIKTRADGR
jgi:Peptidase family M28